MKTFYILSIDGGGILGLYSADVLSKIEKEFCQGKKLYECFNLICGTSTGGIIALALAVGSSTDEIKKFYLRYGSKIFPKFSWHKFFSFCGMRTNKYKNQILKEALEEFFGEKTVADCKTKICIPAINASLCQPIVFKTNNNGEQKRDENVKLTDIALATSAAPTFLPIHSFGDYRMLVDGGMWQNNPSLIGAIEATTYFVGKEKDYDEIKILSIGNPSSAKKEALSQSSKSSGLCQWKENLVTMPMKISSIATHQILNFMCRNKALNISDYLRIECSNLPSHCQKLKLDSASKEDFEKLLELSLHDFNINKDKIITFFQRS